MDGRAHDGVVLHRLPGEVEPQLPFPAVPAPGPGALRRPPAEGADEGPEADQPVDARVAEASAGGVPAPGAPFGTQKVGKTDHAPNIGSAGDTNPRLEFPETRIGWRAGRGAGSSYWWKATA